MLNVEGKGIAIILPKIPNTKFAGLFGVKNGENIKRQVKAMMLLPAV
jgi:hypothetical protein